MLGLIWGNRLGLHACSQMRDAVQVRGLAEWVDRYWKEAMETVSRASEDGLISPPTNPPTLDCLSGQCLRQSSLPSSLLWHYTTAQWRATGKLWLHSARWHAAVSSLEQKEMELWQIAGYIRTVLIDDIYP